jgi:hypothetical protein
MSLVPPLFWDPVNRLFFFFGVTGGVCSGTLSVELEVASRAAPLCLSQKMRQVCTFRNIVLSVRLVIVLHLVNIHFELRESIVEPHVFPFPF